jgi:CheY-like chemotaxis protein
MNNGVHEFIADSLPSIVLLVEGQPDTLQTYSRYLESAGLWVATVSDPSDGLSQVRELRPNLLVTDVTFDGRPRGIDLVHAVKQDARTSHIPVLVLSGTAVRDLPLETQREADLVLVKPVVPKLLYRRGCELIAANTTSRARSSAASEPAHSLLDQNLATRLRGREIVETANNATRACPKCGSALEWLERGAIGGVEYDYYRWCLTGCGLYCFDRRSRCWIKLAG